MEGLVEGVATKPCEVMFKLLQAVGVDSGPLRLRTLRSSFLLEVCEALFVTKDPLRIRELLAETISFLKVLQPRTNEVIGLVAKYPIKGLDQLGITILRTVNNACIEAFNPVNDSEHCALLQFGKW